MSEEAAPMDLVFLAVVGGKWALQRTDHEGKVARDAAGDVIPGLQTAEDIWKAATAKGDERFVAVVWQREVAFSAIGKNPFEKRAVVDLYQLAWVLVATDEVRDRKLATVAGWCDVLPMGLDDPTRAVVVVRDSYVRLVARLKTGMQVEGFGRALVQSATEKAMQIVARVGGGLSGGKQP